MTAERLAHSPDRIEGMASTSAHNAEEEYQTNWVTNETTRRVAKPAAFVMDLDPRDDVWALDRHGGPLNASAAPLVMISSGRQPAVPRSPGSSRASCRAGADRRPAFLEGLCANAQHSRRMRAEMGLAG